MPKPKKSAKKAVAKTVSERGANACHPKDPKQLAKEWGLKIRQNKEAAEEGKRALAEIIVPYFNEVQREIASEDFLFGVSQLKDQKPVRVHFRIERGLTAAISVTSEGIILERSDRPKENITQQIDVKDPAHTIENITKLITALMERKT